jgi:hypothetical protein
MHIDIKADTISALPTLYLRTIKEHVTTGDLPYHQDMISMGLLQPNKSQLQTQSMSKHKTCVCHAMPWLRQLVAGLLPWRPVFDPRPVCVGF